MQIGKIAYCAGMATLLMACNTTSPQWDAGFGSITRSTLSRQIVDPRASRNADPVIGMDGKAARSAYQRMNGAQAASGVSGGDSGSSSGSKGRGGNAADVNFGVNAQTGQVYPGVPGGVINPQNGAFYPDVGPGYINPTNGSFMPKL